ncbi:MAG: DUF1329 domain-containing protein [Betaproteobacteria bacterium]|nr:DUF1329 domain-containing protein [Betaproteobacteria bacterium]
MHIRKFDHDYSRRAFLAKAGTMAGAGILAPLWPTIANSADISKVYPDELMSIDAYTKGKVKTGDMITAANVDIVKDLLPPITYIEIKEMGRKIKIVPTTKDVTRLFPADYLEATLRNAGKAKFDTNNNVVNADGKPWIGGNPFPDAKTALEAIANGTLSWGRADNAIYVLHDTDIGPDGKIAYEYDLVWIEENTTGRIGPGGPYMKGHEDKLRYNTVFFTQPTDVSGSAFLSTWYNDQRKFPELLGFVPAFKRVRKFPTNQRFEPMVPGFTFYLSDAWGNGDPMLTWGNFKVIERRPMLGAQSQTWNGDDPNWNAPVHGGPQNQSFIDTNMELCPECLVVEAEPIGYPRAPVGKKRLWIDVRNQLFIGYHTYDRRGALFKSFEPQFGLYEKGNIKDMTGKQTTWSWSRCLAHDIQSNRLSRYNQNKEIPGGFKSGRNVDGMYEKFMTEQAIGRLGA